MAGRRVFLSGMGGELGSRVAALLEGEPWVESLLGIDVDPPRRRLRRAAFHLVQPSHRERIVDLVTSFDPHVVIHLSVWEPESRAGPQLARRLTGEATTAVLGAAAECPALESIVLRSGTEVYGRYRNAPTRPHEGSPLRPTCDFGRTLAGIEDDATALGRQLGVAVGAVRLAPVLGPHVPSPLGRLLRHPVVPFSLLADSPFAVLADVDAGRAFVAAAGRRLAEPVNVVSRGAITGLQAIRRGGHIPLPIIGPEWVVARWVSHLLGAPIPDHVMEMLHRGRLADGSRSHELLGVAPTSTTPEIIDRVHAWESVVHIVPSRSAA